VFCEKLIPSSASLLVFRFATEKLRGAILVSVIRVGVYSASSYFVTFFKVGSVLLSVQCQCLLAYDCFSALQCSGKGLALLPKRSCVVDSPEGTFKPTLVSGGHSDFMSWREF
jgi:hypothetical protein